jgi:uncharacterized protein
MTVAQPPSLEDLFRGLVFYGTGGGGRAETGIALLRRHFGDDWRPSFTNPSTLSPDSYACATIVLGGRDPAEDVSADERRALCLADQDLAMGQRFARSVEALERCTGRMITALAVVELGSMAMAATLIAGDLLGKAVLDCDCTGRSIPQLGLAKLDLVGLSPAPAAFVDRFGGQTIALQAASAAMVDRIGRHVSRAVWGRGVACACYPERISRFREGVVEGSIAKAEMVGHLLGGPRATTERLDNVLAATGGRLLFEGIAKGTQWRNTEPYQFRELEYEISGSGRDEGRVGRVWVKNEHHMVWRDNILIASSPDPIALLDAASLDPLTTLGDVKPERKLLVLASPALDPIWKTEAGALMLGPRRFGFDLDPVLI